MQSRESCITGMLSRIFFLRSFSVVSRNLLLAQTKKSGSVIIVDGPLLFITQEIRRLNHLETPLNSTEIIRPENETVGVTGLNVPTVNRVYFKKLLIILMN